MMPDCLSDYSMYKFAIILMQLKEGLCRAFFFKATCNWANPLLDFLTCLTLSTCIRTVLNGDVFLTPDLQGVAGVA